jgi:hypothetical protein
MSGSSVGEARLPDRCLWVCDRVRRVRSSESACAVSCAVRSKSRRTAAVHFAGLFGYKTPAQAPKPDCLSSLPTPREGNRLYIGETGFEPATANPYMPISGRRREALGQSKQSHRAPLAGVEKVAIRRGLRVTVAACLHFCSHPRLECLTGAPSERRKRVCKARFTKSRRADSNR